MGVLGGMGPAATLDFFAKVLERTRAKTDQDHLRLIIDNNPSVPDRNAAVAGLGPSPGPMLAAMAQGLERAGADVLVMVCNAAHAYEEDVRSATALPFISIVAETVRSTLERAPKARTVGVLASSGCLDAGLYETAFAAHRVRTVVPEGAAREAFMELLYRIKAGDMGDAVRREMLELAEGLLRSGAEALVAGCTEVPLVLAAEDLSVPLVASTDALVTATLAYARGERALLAEAPKGTP